MSKATNKKQVSYDKPVETSAAPMAKPTVKPVLKLNKNKASTVKPLELKATPQAELDMNVEDTMYLQGASTMPITEKRIPWTEKEDKFISANIDKYVVRQLREKLEAHSGIVRSTGSLSVHIHKLRKEGKLKPSTLSTTKAHAATPVAGVGAVGSTIRDIVKSELNQSVEADLKPLIESLVAQAVSETIAKLMA